jgi:hypothetical protein
MYLISVKVDHTLKPKKRLVVVCSGR